MTASGSLNERRFVEEVIVQALAGGIAMFLVAIVKHSIEHHKSAKG